MLSQIADMDTNALHYNNQVSTTLSQKRNPTRPFPLYIGHKFFFSHVLHVFSILSLPQTVYFLIFS